MCTASQQMDTLRCQILDEFDIKRKSLKINLISHSFKSIKTNKRKQMMQ